MQNTFFIESYVSLKSCCVHPTTDHFHSDERFFVVVVLAVLLVVSPPLSLKVVAAVSVPVVLHQDETLL